MAAVGEEDNRETEIAKPYDIKSLLCSPDRDFLIKNNGDQVKVESLQGKKLGLYFSASWCGPCKRFTPALIEAYNELSARGDFEVVFVSADKNDESFKEYFSKMPWLAVPYAESDKRDSLDSSFKVMGIPHLVILDETGNLVSDDGVEIIREYGVEGYPFTQERIKELKDQEEDARRNQSLKLLLAHGSRDFVIKSDRNKVPISELEGKMVGLCFYLSSYKSVTEFVPKLLEVYQNVKARGEHFEVVLIPLDDKEEPFMNDFEGMPWLSLPVQDKTCEKLVRYFELSTLPTLVIIGPDGKTVHSNVAEAIEDHGVAAYPFTAEKFAELAEINKAREEAQTLELVLVSGDLDYVIGKGGSRIPVADLVGKTILLYFSAHWCPPCRAFLPKLIEAYLEIKAKDDAFEVIFISSDRDQASFDKYYEEMPWLALPFGDRRKASLSRKFKVSGIPMLVALGPTGRTVSKEARSLITQYGADAYPFTEEHLKKIEERLEEMRKGWPEKLKHSLHVDHELKLTRRMMYTCDGCRKAGQVWSYYCEKCDFDLHPNCAFKDEAKKEEGTKEESTKEGWVCEGGVCHKA